MKIKAYHALLFVNPLLLASPLQAAIPNSGHPDTQLGPTLKASLNSLLTDNSGYSFAGELGSRNVRINGTVAARFFDRHLLKLSGEFLWQEITYAYFSGNQPNWTNQGALGATYLYDFNYYDRLHPQFSLNAYYAHSASALLAPRTGTYTTSSGVVAAFTNTRRVGGADSRGISPGFKLRVLPGTKVGMDLNYDKVRYTRKLLETGKIVDGFGASLHLDQQLTDFIFAGVDAEFRQPFNYYDANIAWQSGPCDGPWQVKLAGVYTNGKKALPSSSDIVLSFNYFLDRQYSPLMAEREKNELLAWNVKPAVHLPEVLVVADESVT